MSTSATGAIGANEPMAAQGVPLLYVCDWPPSNLGGGPILMSRLLHRYPPDMITVLTSTRFARVSPKEGRLKCDEITVPLSEGYGRFGLGRLRTLLNRLRIPAIAITVRRIVRQRQIAVILTVLHGQLCFAAAIAGWMTDVPYVVVVHDDYLTDMNFFGRWLTRALMRGAAHIYCVSSGMKETIRRNFGVDAELQLPATERHADKPARLRGHEIVIVFAGSITGAVEDNLKLLAALITSGRFREIGIDAQLHLYTVLKRDQQREWGWNHPSIVIHGWVAQAELTAVLCKADILFLPFSFAPAESHTVKTAFPSKTADYLASGTPILVFGPKYSTLVAYARREGFGEIVTEPDGDLLGQAIQRIVRDPAHREALRQRALAVFAKYHDISQQRADFVRLLNTIVCDKAPQAVSNPT